MYETKNLQIYFTSLLFFAVLSAGWVHDLSEMWRGRATCSVFRCVSEQRTLLRTVTSEPGVVWPSIKWHCTVRSLKPFEIARCQLSARFLEPVELYCGKDIQSQCLPYSCPLLPLCPSFHPRWIEMGKGVIPGQEKVLWSGSQVTRIGGKVWWHLVDR